MGKEIQANEFYKLFKRHLNSKKQAQLRVVKCANVNWGDKTMTAVDNEGLELFNISLGLGSVCIKPQQDSLCIVGLLEGQDTIAFLINAEKVELIELNGGKNGGLTITPELVTQLDKMTARIDGIISALNNAVPATGAPDSGATLIGNIKTGLASIIDKEDFGDIEDTKITH